MQATCSLLVVVLIIFAPKASSIAMATRDSSPPNAATFTTNEHDQREAARIRHELQSERNNASTCSNNNISSSASRLPSVEICEGAHKYVQITASLDGAEQTFVVSRRNASYHRNAAEPFIAKLRQHGYCDIEVAGGGRVDVNADAKQVSIFGFSYGFGKANHELSADIVRRDERYNDFDVSWSDDGY